MSDFLKLPTDPADCEKAVISPMVPCATYNVAIAGLDAELFGMMFELKECVSATQDSMSAEDHNRFTKQMDKLIATLTILRTTDTDKRTVFQWPLSKLELIFEPVRNPVITNVINMLLSADVELRQCPSAVLRDGLQDADAERLTKALTKCSTYINDQFNNHNASDRRKSVVAQEIVAPTMLTT